MQAIILAGGFGSRLQSVVKDVPKPMALIRGKPFLDYLLHYLVSQQIKKVTLSLHHQADIIQSYYAAGFPGLELTFVIERKPLGTGGAIRYALSHVDKTQPVFIINGDTLLHLNYEAMHDHHVKSDASFTMALREVSDCSRYGRVIVDENHIVQFREKEHDISSGLINGGVYLLSPLWFHSLLLPEIFSLEQHFLLQAVSSHPFSYVITNGYFIDIGIPADYHRANQEFTSPLEFSHA